MQDFARSWVILYLPHLYFVIGHLPGFVDCLQRLEALFGELLPKPSAERLGLMVREKAFNVSKLVPAGNETENN